jgi:hypothetical protein
MYCPIPFGARKAARALDGMEILFSCGSSSVAQTIEPETLIVREGRTKPGEGAFVATDNLLLWCVHTVSIGGTVFIFKVLIQEICPV